MKQPEKVPGSHSIMCAIGLILSQATDSVSTGTPTGSAELKNQGLINRILLSHDSGWYDPAKPGGGIINGYTDIFEYLIPALKKRGFTDSDIDQLLIKNPAEAFTIKIRNINK